MHLCSPTQTRSLGGSAVSPPWHGRLLVALNVRLIGDCTGVMHHAVGDTRVPSMTPCQRRRHARPVNDPMPALQEELAHIFLYQNRSTDSSATQTRCPLLSVPRHAKRRGAYRMPKGLSHPDTFEIICFELNL